MVKNVGGYEKFKSELLAKPEVSKEYEALKPQFDLIRQYIALRNKKNISQAELAKRIGSRQTAISRLEGGYPNTTIGTWQKIAEALDAELVITFQPKKCVKT